MNRPESSFGTGVDHGLLPFFVKEIQYNKDESIS
jgi:hypothetical protein